MINKPRGTKGVPQSDKGSVSRQRKATKPYDSDNAISVKPVKLKPSKLGYPKITDQPKNTEQEAKTAGVRSAEVKQSTARASVNNVNNKWSSYPRRTVSAPRAVDDDDNAVKLGRSREKPKPTSKKDRAEKAVGGLTVGCIVKRSLLVLLTVIVFAVGSLYALCFTVAHGPSEEMRNRLVMTALQASATKWVPGLFLDSATVDKIWADSQKVTVDVIPAGDYGQKDDVAQADEWENAIDGMIYETISGPTYKGYVLLVRDPSRLYVATSCDFSAENRYGMRIFEIAERENAMAAINAGEYVDNGFSLGDTPIGLTYSKGEMVWNDHQSRTFIGFDRNNKLVVTDSMTQAEADRLGIRDAVSFQWGNKLIDNEDGNVRLYYTDQNTGAAQRTAIGQRADGTVILVVTDGRTASSPGATRNNIIDVMVSYGAVTAGMLDGGSSSMMYYRDYYDKYDIDKSRLDQYQLKGIVNSYKAFTNPRTMPTFFVVKP